MRPATLTGLAVGDSLGMPFETHHFTSEALLAWDGTFQSGATNTIQPNLRPGQWTDDTKMALALANSLISSETYDPIGATQHYIEWYDSNDHRGMGKATKEALERIIQGHHWMNSGVKSQGNGTAMRVAPLGLFYHHSPEAAAAAARIDARITHNSQLSIEGSVIVAVAVAILASGAPKVVDSADGDHDLIRRVLYYSETCALWDRLVDVRECVEELPADPTDRLKASMKTLLEMGTGAHVLQTVPAAFLCFLATSSFAEAVDLAVRVGGDTDTTAAITGALAGTFYGTEQVKPYLGVLEEAALLSHLENRLFLSAPRIP